MNKTKTAGPNKPDAAAVRAANTINRCAAIGPEWERIITREYHPLVEAAQGIMAIAQSDTTMESPHWHFRTTRGPEVEAAIVALQAALRLVVGEEGSGGAG